jgi:hypothetical protein
LTKLETTRRSRSAFDSQNFRRDVCKSPPVAVGAAALPDIWDLETRPKAWGTRSMQNPPQLTPTLGQFCATWSQHVTLQMLYATNRACRLIKYQAYRHQVKTVKEKWKVEAG